ncbi:hypothetical protein [Methylobacterium gnaphalii]|nr:hypothetical protein [Methylobacterium gnaphalii]
MGQIAGKVAVEILDEIEDAKVSEILSRWDELKALMPTAFEIAQAAREALLKKGYGA